MAENRASPPPPPPTSSPSPPNRSDDLRTYCELNRVLRENTRAMIGLRFHVMLLGNLSFTVQAVMSICMLWNPRKRAFILYFFPSLTYFAGMATIICAYLGIVGRYDERALAFSRFHVHLYDFQPEDDFVSQGKRARFKLWYNCVVCSIISLLLTFVNISLSDASNEN